jgi:hypothetical protein
MDRINENREWCGNKDRCDDFPFCDAHAGRTTEARNLELMGQPECTCGGVGYSQHLATCPVVVRQTTQGLPFELSDSYDKVRGLMDEARIHIEDAIDALRQAEVESRRNNGPYWLHGQLEAYTIATLRAFIENESQTGSLPGLERGLDEYVEEQAELECEFCGESDERPIREHLMSPPVMGWEPDFAMAHEECAARVASDMVR